MGADTGGGEGRRGLLVARAQAHVDIPGKPKHIHWVFQNREFKERRKQDWMPCSFLGFS
jgi:hypothetical protein